MVVVTHLRSSSFVRDITILASGTAVAQAITIAGAPILSRLYHPSAFGILALLIAVAGPVSMMASLKYEMAIVLEKKDEDAANVLLLSIFSVLAIVTLTAGLVFFLGDWLAARLGTPLAAPLMAVIPLQIFIGGMAGALLFWQTRRKLFGRISAYSIRRSVGVVGLQVGAGLLSAGARGLVLGRIIGDFISMIILAYQVVRQDGRLIIRSFAPARIATLARIHIKFPKYNAPRALLHSFSTSVPSILLAILFSPIEAGLYWFTYRLLDMPVNLIGQGIKRVFYQRAADLYHKGQSVRPILGRTTAALAGIAVLPTLLIVFLASPLFAVAFGEEWREAGLYAQWLAINAFVLFVIRPSAMLVPVFELQKFALWMEVASIITRVVVMVFAALSGDPVLAIALYSVVGVIFSLGLMARVFHVAWRYEPANVEDPQHAS